MTHRYAVGAAVYFEAAVHAGGARGVYKVIRHMPVERDNRILYRIKSITENFERTVEEDNLSRQD